MDDATSHCNNIRSSILLPVEMEFRQYLRPVNFTNLHHCEECFEHNETLKAFRFDDPDKSKLIIPGWDPVTFSTPEAFKYMLPYLCIYALDSQGLYYIDRFLFHMACRQNQFIGSERKVMSVFLTRLHSIHKELITQNLDNDDIYQVTSMFAH